MPVPNMCALVTMVTLHVVLVRRQCKAGDLFCISTCVFFCSYNIRVTQEYMYNVYQIHDPRVKSVRAVDGLK